MKYENRYTTPISTARFARRMGSHVAVAVALIGVSLFGGMIGYHILLHLPWLDAFLNAAMILGGMGPVDPITTRGGKLFAGLYALYAGAVFLAVASVVVAPVIHRILHKFHWEDVQSRPGS